jgi:hypothetical protein
MKEIIFNILEFLGCLALAIFFVYVRYRNLQSRVKDLGDGGIQTIFGGSPTKIAAPLAPYPLWVILGAHDFAVTHVDDAVAIFRRFGVVGDHQNCLSQFLI